MTMTEAQGCKWKPKGPLNGDFCIILLSKGSDMAKPKLRGREVHSAFTGEVSTAGLGLESIRHSLPAAKLCKYNVKFKSFTTASLCYHFGQNPKSLTIF